MLLAGICEHARARLDRDGTAQGGQESLLRIRRRDNVVDAECGEALPLPGILGEADDPHPTGSDARAVPRRQAGEVGREQHGSGRGLGHSALEVVGVSRARLRLEDGVAAEEDTLDGMLGNRRQAENDR
ncbi:MAG TPA: hypothetical protein VNK94_07775 [Gaiellaceae bacterium]|nr:hypothetical protein [Gaiellaceae bacterium]